MERTLGRAAVGLVSVLVLALTLVGCGEDGGSSSGGGSGGASADDLEDVVVIDGPEADVKVLDNTFNAENIQVAPGTRVVWTNDGRQDHDIVPAEGRGFGIEPDDFGPDAVYEHTFEEPGVYRYYCSLHGTAVAGMVGAVVVKE